MQLSTLLPLPTLLSLALALPSATTPSISVDVFDDTACKIPTVRGYSFTANNVCKQFIKAEGSVTAVSLNGPVKQGCVLQVFGDTACKDVFAAVTVDGKCQRPVLGPVSSGKLVGC
ncbi:MAG: hypothetical protein Q9182_004574 [Xanthomendoza sp. 2 TL-2023]